MYTTSGTPKLDDHTWEGHLVGCSSYSKAYRIYNSTTRRVVESPNVSFIETLEVGRPPECVDLTDETMDSDIDLSVGNKPSTTTA